MAQVYPRMAVQAPVPIGRAMAHDDEGYHCHCVIGHTRMRKKVRVRVREGGGA